MLLPEMRQPNRLRRHRSHRPGPRKQPAGRSIEHVEATARVVGEPLGRLPLLSSGTVRTADWRTAAEAPATGCQRGTPPRAMHSRAGKVERLRQALQEAAVHRAQLLFGRLQQRLEASEGLLILL